MDLGEAGQPDADAMAVRVARDVFAEALHVLGALGARADEGHVAADDIPQLRQLVERGAAQEAADRGAPVDALDTAGGAAVNGDEAGVVGDAHRAELEHLEDLAVLADAALAEEDGTARAAAHGERERDQQRQDEQQRDERDAAADEVLGLEGDGVGLDGRSRRGKQRGGHGDGEGQQERERGSGNTPQPSDICRGPPIPAYGYQTPCPTRPGALPLVRGEVWCG